MGSHRLNIVLDEPSLRKLDQIQKELYGLNKSAIIRMLLAKYEEVQKQKAEPQPASPWTPAPVQRRVAPAPAGQPVVAHPPNVAPMGHAAAPAPVASHYSPPAASAPQVAAAPPTTAPQPSSVRQAPIQAEVEFEHAPPAENEATTKDGSEKTFRVKTHRSDFW